MSAHSPTLTGMTTNRDPYQCFTRDDAAAFLTIHPVTLSKMVRQGRIPCARIGKRVVFTRGALEAFLRGETYDPLGADDTALPPTPSMFN